MERRHERNLRWWGGVPPANSYVLVNYSGLLSTQTGIIVKRRASTFQDCDRATTRWRKRHPC